MRHVHLLLRRPAARERSLQSYVTQLHDRNSPNFHHWLTSERLAADFGVSQQDLTTVAAWLGSRGWRRHDFA